ncbi:hypothetical protein EMMF5_000677 [Cystobasidiomycetes sp. EMM_F5]
MADIRALMKQKAAGKRISHPYAKYGNSGQLSCSLCGVPVKSDVLWPSHLSSKVHRNSVRKEKEQLEQQQEQEQSDVANLRKRAASDPPDALDENGQQDKMSSKRVRFDESLDEANVPTSLPSADIDANPSTSSSFLPAGFFDDPSQVPQINGNEARDYEDEEWAAFEATLAAEADSAEQQQNTSSVPFSAHATFSAQEVLYDNDNDETPNGDAANGQAGDIEEEDNDEPKETEQKRKEREDREELMQRIEMCVHYPAFFAYQMG